MKNFDQWFQEKMPRQPIESYKKNVRLGWVACKEEVLKILSKNKTTVYSESNGEDIDEIGIDFIDLEVIDKIKKL